MRGRVSCGAGRLFATSTPRGITGSAERDDSRRQFCSPADEVAECSDSARGKPGSVTESNRGWLRGLVVGARRNPLPCSSPTLARTTASASPHAPGGAWPAGAVGPPALALPVPAICRRPPAGAARRPAPRTSAVRSPGRPHPDPRARAGPAPAPPPRPPRALPRRGALRMSPPERRTDRAGGQSGADGRRRGRPASRSATSSAERGRSARHIPGSRDCTQR